MAGVLRILDANFNRAREALRVMEEAARFVLDHAQLAGALKQLRHDLAGAMAPWSGSIAHRDTPGDVGTTLTTADQARRAGVVEVAIAAGKRLAEALRAIEEYAKVLGDQAAASGPELAATVAVLRYRGYELERKLNLALGSGRRRQWRLCLLLTESLCAPHPWDTVLGQCLEAGVDAVQVREKTMDGGDLLGRVQRVVALCRPHGASVIVNDRPDVALLAGADGVHLGQADLPIEAVRRLAGGQLLVGVSTADLEQARAAVDAGSDYCGVGPMFISTTKHKPHLAGPAYLRAFIRAHPRTAHLAIGGIGPMNIQELVDAGVRGVAVSSALCAAAEPGRVAQTLLEHLPERLD